MNKNVRIAKELVKLAKLLVATKQPKYKEGDEVYCVVNTLMDKVKIREVLPSHQLVSLLMPYQCYEYRVYSSKFGSMTVSEEELYKTQTEAQREVNKRLKMKYKEQNNLPKELSKEEEEAELNKFLK